MARKIFFTLLQENNILIALQRYLLPLLCAVMLFGCGTVEFKAPEDVDKGSYNPYGGMVSGQNSSDFSIFGISDNEVQSETTKVNALLWQASLQTISFMGIKAIEPGQGTIVTEWYKSNATPNFEIQLIVSISGSTLRSNNLQVVSAKRSAMGNMPSDNEFAARIKDTILVKARELRTK